MVELCVIVVFGIDSGLISDIFMEFIRADHKMYWDLLRDRNPTNVAKVRFVEIAHPKLIELAVPQQPGIRFGRRSEELSGVILDLVNALRELRGQSGIRYLLGRDG